MTNDIPQRGKLPNAIEKRGKDADPLNQNHFRFAL